MSTRTTFIEDSGLSISDYYALMNWLFTSAVFTGVSESSATATGTFDGVQFDVTLSGSNLEFGTLDGNVSIERGNVTSITFSVDGSSVMTVSTSDFNFDNFFPIYSLDATGVTTSSIENYLLGLSQTFNLSNIDNVIAEGDLIGDGVVYAQRDRIIFNGQDGNDTFTGGIAADSLIGNDGDDSLFGLGGNDFLSGGFGSDLLEGGDGNDRLDGGVGNDIINAGDGSDSITANAGDDIIDGGDGFDTVDLSLSVQPLTISLAQQGQAQFLFNLGTDTWTSIEGLVGTEFNDTFTGSDVANVLSGGLGNDVLDGGAGNDRLNGNDGDDELIGGAGDDFLSGDDGDDQLNGGSGDDRLQGDAGDDVINGGIGNDRIEGGAGVNVLNGGDGNDFFEITDFTNTVNGGDGFDSLEFDGNFAGEAVDLGSLASGLSITSIEQFIFRDAVTEIRGQNIDDNISASGFSAVIFGLDGNDNISTSSGADTIYGGNGNDTINSSSGNDILFGGDGDDNLNASTGNDILNGGAGNDSLGGSTGNDILDGGDGDDNLSGSTGDDLFLISAGNDSISGSSDTDTISLANLSSGGTITVNGTSGTVEFVNGTSTFSSVELFVGSDFNDIFVGGQSDDTFDGGAGNDVFNGGEGADVLDGGDGFDTASYSDASEGVFASLIVGGVTGEAAGDSYSNIESLRGSNFNDVLVGRDGTADFLFGGQGSDGLRGNGGNDFMYGEGGNDLFFSGFGADLHNGGSGIDTVLYNQANAGVIVNLDAGTGALGHAAGDTYVSIENIVGSGFGDLIIGSEGANSLQGRNGNDTLDGRGGADFLNGGNGLDTVTYANSNGGVVASLFTGIGTFADAEGDTYADIEGLTGSDFNDLLIGRDGAADTLRGGDGSDGLRGNGGDDMLFGEGGNDLLFSGFGADHHDGGAGVDTILFNAAGAGVIVNLLAGTGTFGHAAGDTYVNIENVVGTAFGDLVIGSEAANNLQGRAGNDVLDGRGGSDVLVGGNNADRFIFSDGYGTDRVEDFSSAEGDVIDVRDFGFTSFAQVQALMFSNGGDTVINFGDGDALRLVGVDMNSLTASDFLLSGSPNAKPSDAQIESSVGLDDFDQDMFAVEDPFAEFLAEAPLQADLININDSGLGEYIAPDDVDYDGFDFAF